MTKQNNNNKKTKQSLGNPVSYNNSRPNSRVQNSVKVWRGSDVILPSYSATALYSAQSQMLNPRLSEAFPSASLQAARFDKYEFESLEFRWVPNQAVTTTPGTIFLAYEPNPNRETPNTLQAINAYECYMSTPVYSPNCVLRIPKHMLKGMRFTREGPVLGDLSIYDPGIFIIASQGASTNPQGYVEARYVLRFDSYHLESPMLALSNKRVGQVDLSVNQVVPTLVQTTVLFDTVVRNFGDWDIPITAGRVILPPGVYLLLLTLEYNDSVAESFDANFNVYKNAVSLERGFVTNSNTWGGFNTQHVGNVVVESNGTDEFWVDVILTGAAGVLRVDAIGTSLIMVTIA